MPLLVGYGRHYGQLQAGGKGRGPVKFASNAYIRIFSRPAAAKWRRVRLWVSVMSYQPISAGGTAELTCNYGASKLVFRGPERALSRPYVACLGGAETFGRFVEHPFPALLQQRLGRRCINFGSLFCGAEALLQDEGLTELANGSVLCVLQLPDLGGHSNRFYRVHPRRNDRFVAPTPDLVKLYPEEDFTEIHFVGHLLMRLQTHSDGRFEQVSHALQQSWIDHLQTVLDQITCPVVLLALELESHLRIEPFMLSALAPFCARIVHLQAQVSGMSDDLEDVLFGTLQQPMAEHMIGPATHRRVADVMACAIQDLDL